MARGLGRSKGCQNCLRRKIKCDEKTPECTQCARGGRQCSGALSTVFLIVDSGTLTTNPTYKPREMEPEEESPPNKRRALRKSTKKTSQAMQKASRRKCRTIPPKVDGMTPPPAISNHQVIADQFLSKFITFFANSSPRQVLFNSWMTTLPDMLSARSLVIEKSIIAASMIYFGQVSSNQSIIFESYRWYGSGLNKQRQLLEELQSGKREPTVEEICTPIVLSFFEITCCTSPTAYFQHLMGAARILEMKGYHACSSGVLNQLFNTLRIQVTYPSIILRVPSIFSTKEWLTVPFLGRPKSVLDHVIDAITQISSLLPRLDASRTLEDPYEADLQQLCIRVEATKIKEQLDRLWDDLRDASTSHGWKGNFFKGVPGFDSVPPKSQQPFPDDDLTVQYPTKNNDTGYPSPPPPHPARYCYAESRSTAFYSTARILVLSLLADLGVQIDLLQEQFEAHSESILAVATHLTTMDVGYAYVRLVLSLTVVWRHSPVAKQRARAREILETWRLKGGVAGLCEVALAEMQEEPALCDEGEIDKDEKMQEDTLLDFEHLQVVGACDNRV